jgi:hypothetical protein
MSKRNSNREVDALIYTSVDDCRAGCIFDTDRTIRAALVEARRLKMKTRIAILERELRRRERES